MTLVRERPMRMGLWSSVAVVLVLTTPAPGVAQASEEEEAVLAVVRTLFDGMREKDEAKLRSVWHPEARLQSAGPAPDGGFRVTSTPVDSFIESVVGAAAHLDEVTFDEEVRIDGALATAWTPYNFFANDALSHCGVNAIQMVRTDDGWKILQVTDTRTREGCDPSRRDG